MVTETGVGRPLARLIWILLPLSTAGCLPPDLPATPEVGQLIPDFSAVRISTGETVSLASLRGQPVVLNLWATWCPPCRAETPYFQSIYERFHDRGLEMVGVTVDTPSALDLAVEFLEEHSVSYIQLHDPDMESMDIFDVIGLPATYIMDAEGIIRFKRAGPVLEGDPAFEGLIEELVEASR